MKYSKYILPFLVLLICSCVKDEIDDIKISVDSKNIDVSANKNISNPQFPIRSKTELIVEYNPEVSENIKKSLRHKFDVIKYKTCDCVNKRIELWSFGEQVDIEGRKDEITQEGVGVEGVDFQFYYTTNLPRTYPNIPNINSQSENLITSYVVENNVKTTIAFLDTGINLRALPQTEPFLYRLNEDETPCDQNGLKEISGWDFINNDNDTYDDSGHGTVVTGIAKSMLAAENISSYQVLPVKIFDKNGKGTIFTTLCGYLYAVDKKSVSIINMSFGWYGVPSSLFSKFISENSDILHITSSGNEKNDNDVLYHYPSSYKFKNILSIGSINTNVDDIASFSNFGLKNVDYLSHGDSIFFVDGNNYTHQISGTSFAAPLVTAKAAKYHSQGYTILSEMKLKIYNNATILPINYSLPVKYGDRIIE